MARVEAATSRSRSCGCRAPFRISGFVFEEQDVVVVTLDDGTHRGRGEAAGVYYLRRQRAAAWSPRSRRRAARSRRASIAPALQRLLPPGGARNAVDCALWELEAQRAGMPVWKLAGLPPPKPLLTTFTLGADDPDGHGGARARATRSARAIKLKLTGELDLDIARVQRGARARGRMSGSASMPTRATRIDALPAADRRLLDRRDVSLLEQPLPRGREADLDGFDSPIPIAADESVLDARRRAAAWSGASTSSTSSSTSAAA